MSNKDKKYIEVLQHQFHEKYSPKSKRNGRYGVIYTRVSSMEQAQNNGSLEVQMKYCQEYAKTNDIQILQNFGGTYESAKSDGRKEFQRMLDFVKKNKTVSYIIILNYDRFSRTGAAAAKLSEDLRKEGIIVKSVTQDIDTSTASGRLQENMFHMINNFDNRAKSDRTIINTREVMLKGYWPYSTPLGYKNLKPKHRACFHEYVITEEGKELKKAFILKAEGKLTNVEIIRTLQKRGVNITQNNFRLIIANPFYAGFITGSLVQGKLIKGKHPQLVDLKTFIRANEAMKEAPNVGVPKVFRHDELPLKTFAIDEINGVAFTGYKTKGIWYYKTKIGNPPSNVKASVLNELFIDLLSQYQCKQEHMPVLEKYITEYLKQCMQDSASQHKVLQKRITEKEKQIEALEEKYLGENISRELFEKYNNKYVDELTECKKQLSSNEFHGSNLEKAIKKCLKISQNLKEAWVSATYEDKQTLQKLVFPNGVVYNKENRTVRTLRSNTLFSCIPVLTRVLEEKKSGNLGKDCLKTSNVPRTGIELISFPRS